MSGDKESFGLEKAIECQEDDRLDRKSVAKELAQSIKSYTYDDSLTIGIIGDWGSGKTSFINMVLENLKEESGFIKIHFNPWNISTRQQLISDFFIKLKNEIGKKDLAKTYKKLGKNLQALSRLFKPLSYIPAFSSIASTLSDSLKSLGEAIKIFGETQEKDLETIKEEINEELGKLNKKIIIVIDDLDRLSDKDIQEVFQLVKSIADFKHTIYILAYDEEVVSKALDKIQKDKGQKYIEKIVQVPMVLPQLNKIDLAEIFMNKIKNLDIKYKNIDKDFLERIEPIADVFDNIRDINRYLNVLKSEMAAIKQELDLYDFAVITLFKVFEPRLYEHIYNEKDKLVNRIHQYTEIDEILKGINLTKFNKEEVTKLLCSIFPRINSKDSSFKLNYSSVNKQISEDKYFDYFFMLKFPDNEIPKEAFEKIANAETEQEYKDIFDDSKYDLKTFKGLQEISRFIEIHQLKDKEQFLFCILSIFDEIKIEEPKEFTFKLETPIESLCNLYLEIFDFLGWSNKKIVGKITQNSKYSFLAKILFLWNFFKYCEKIYSMDMKETFENIQKEARMLANQLKAIKTAQEFPENMYLILRCMYEINQDEAKSVFITYMKNKDLIMPLLKSFETSLHQAPEIKRYTDCGEFEKIINEILPNPTEKERYIINLCKKELCKENKA